LFKYDLKLSFLNSTEKDIFTNLAKYREYNLSENAIGLLSKSKENDISLSLYLAKNNQFYLSLFRAFSKLDNDEKLDIFIKYPEEIFPQPYFDRVKAMATRTKVPSSLIYSIMKQESAFNKKARSQADAMGLMQVIPRLAQQLSKKFEVPYRNPQDLFDPEINIQLGSFELMEQVPALEPYLIGSKIENAMTYSNSSKKYLMKKHELM
jgi:soluble lytic murein transglycosylase